MSETISSSVSQYKMNIIIVNYRIYNRGVINSIWTMSNFIPLQPGNVSSAVI